jgi:stearoyl-CoA desaturase (delta-9 desaturase)
MSAGEILLVAAVAVGAYSFSLLYITVFYHRGFTHRSLELHPRVRRFVAASAIWVTGLDVKAWVCMHRLHHLEADRVEDPHSPVNVGIVGVARAQLRSYERILVKLDRGDPALTALVADLEFDTHWLNRKRLWFVPHLAHLAAGAALSVGTGIWLLGPAYALGILSHPVQGWLVNSFGHARGTRNFDTPDNSRNNQAVAWLVFGEGLQNNHHAFPASARFAYRRTEPDFGYVLCRLLELTGALRIRRDTLLARSGAAVDVPSAELARSTLT